MKKLFIFMIVLLSAFPAAAELLPNHVYFFVHRGCPFCKLAERYFKKNYADLKIEPLMISQIDNAVLYLECAHRHGLSEDAGTPLICINDHYISGWSEDAPKEFDEYVKPIVEMQKSAVKSK